MTQKTATIVVGPQGCGKTTNAERIQKAYGCEAVVDDWGVGEIKPGVLYMTHDQKAFERSTRGQKGFDFPIRVVTFMVAMEMVKIDEEGRA